MVNYHIIPYHIIPAEHISFDDHHREFVEYLGLDSLFSGLTPNVSSYPACARYAAAAGVTIMPMFFLASLSSTFSSAATPRRLSTPGPVCGK